MADISKCTGVNCPAREACYRYTAEASEYQSYLIGEPFIIENGIFSCEMLWSKNTTAVLDQLTRIVKGEENK
jgi:hypothetical protein